MAMVEVLFCDDGKPFARGRWDYVPVPGMRLDLELPVGRGRLSRRSFVVHETMGAGTAVPGQSDTDVVSVRPGPVRVELRMLVPDMDAIGSTP